jgi:hypothetical protein
VYTVSGSVSGLVGSGLTVTDGLGHTASPNANNPGFSFNLSSGQTYAFSVTAQPTSPTQACNVTSGGNGTVGGGNVTGITVTCQTSTFTVSGTVSGLSGSGLTLNDGAGHIVSAAGGSFSTTLASGTPYSFSIANNPTSPWQTCTVTGGATGTVTNANISGVTASCTTNSYTVGTTVSGGPLVSAMLVCNNVAGANSCVTLSPKITSYTWPAQLSGTSYALSIVRQPAYQTCSFATASSGALQGNNVNVAITCTTPAYPITFTVTNVANDPCSGPITVSDGSQTLPPGTPAALPSGANTESFTPLKAGSSFSMSITYPGYCGCCPVDANGACTAQYTSGVAFATGNINGPLSYAVSCSYIIP